MLDDLITHNEERILGTPLFDMPAADMDAGQFQKLVEEYITEGNEKAPHVELRECDEPLVALTDIPHLWMPRNIPSLDTPSEEIPPLIRKGIAERLGRIQERLLKYRLGLKIFYGLRPIHVQKRLIEVAKQRVRDERPDLVVAKSWADIERLSTKYAAPLSFAPHCTGAAVDLTLYDVDTRQELYFGTTYPQFVPATMTEHPEITGEAHQNRLALRSLMAQEGFWNYPAEWWHFSRGDRSWASFMEQPYAIYGPVQEALQNSSC